MFEAPRKLLRTALAGGIQLDRPQLHSLLERLCAAHVGRLRTALKSPFLAKTAAELEAGHVETLLRETWRQELADALLELPTEAEDHLLVRCSAALHLLDRHHWARRPAFHGEVAELPPELGGGRSQFFAPPERPYLEGIAKDKRLDRGQEDYENDLRWLLDLRWHVARLEERTVAPQLRRVSALIAEALETRLAAEGGLTVALASPFGKLEFQCSPAPSRATDKEGVPYHFLEMDAEQQPGAFDALEKILELCQEKGVDILCFPELTVDNEVLGHVRDWLQAQNLELRPALVVAGTYHMVEAGRTVNRCHVLDGLGNVIFRQDKCTPYRIPARQVPQLPPELVATLGIDARGGVEDIEPARELFLLDSALGRLATPICLDYCGEGLRELLVQSQVNWLLVPAMTPTVAPFLERARFLGTHNRAATFMVNSSWLLGKLDLLVTENLVLGYLPFKGCRQLTGTEVGSDLFLFKIRELLPAAE